MKKSLFYSLIFVLFLSGCKEKEVVPAPTGSIEIVAAGRGQYKFICNATNTDSYVWGTGDNTGGFAEPTPTYQYQKNGTYIVTVQLTGKGGSTTISKGLNVNDVVGAVTFWTRSGNYPIEVYMDNRYIGIISSNYSSSPECGASGTAWTGFSFSPGTYNYFAKEVRSNARPARWEGTITIVGGLCKKLEFTF